MKLVLALMAFSILSACASKKTAEAPAKVETPKTMTAEKLATEPKEEKSAKKSTKKAAKAEAKATSAQEAAVGTAEVNCKAGSDERKLSIQVKGSGCELNYTKAGETKVIASQINGSEKCEEVMTNVKNKLVAANFTCQ